MSSVAFVVSSRPSDVERAAIERMLRSARAADEDLHEVSGLAPAAAGMSCASWEISCHSVAACSAHHSESVLCVADATLYYRNDLAARLRSAASSDVDLVAAAYATARDNCCLLLEGDFAFALWDASAGRVFAARDFVGQRTLFYCATPEAIVISSTVSGVLAHPSVGREVDTETVIEAAACLSRHRSATCFRGVLELPAGHSLSWIPGKAPVVSRFWNMESHKEMRSSENAEELRSLLSNAVRERIASSEHVAVTLSGGWDSTTIYGITQECRRSDSLSVSLTPLSMSYPPGDAGREDETIREVVEFWNGRNGQRDRILWRDIMEVKLFAEDPLLAARLRDDAVGHHFEMWNRHLLTAAPGVGAHVAFTGAGGDQLFHASLAYLSDLARRGRVATAYQQWKTGGGTSLRTFAKVALLPTLPRPIVGAVGQLLGKPVRWSLDREPPAYFNHDYVLKNGLQRRDRETRPVMPRGGMVRAEAFAGLAFAHVGRTMGQLRATALECGVELRHPLLDQRVASFALALPWFEKARGRETKIALRNAARGLLPERVLAPRSKRTGLSGDFFVREMQSRGYRLAEEHSADSPLAQMGVVNGRELKRAWEYFLKSPEPDLALQLFHTLQADMWLRVRL